MPVQQKKVSELERTNGFSGRDVMIISVNANTVPATRGIEMNVLFGKITSNVHVRAPSLIADGNVTFKGANTCLKSNNNFYAKTQINRLIVANTGIQITGTATPANSSTNMGAGVGYMWCDDNYLYRQVANNVIKRIAFSSF